MRKLLLAGVFCGGVAASACAAPITPFSFYAGYFRGGSFSDNFGNRVHFSGFELGVQQSLISLPIFGALNLGASVVLGGSAGGVDGNLYRVYADYKTATAPGSSVYGIVGLGYYYASGGSFGHQSGLGPEFGFGFPLGLRLPAGPSASVEARYR